VLTVNSVEGLYLWLITNLVWTAVSAAAAAQPIHLFVDEGWHLLQYAGTAAELGAMARRFRKHYAAIYLTTQFGQDLARSPDAEVIRDAVRHLPQGEARVDRAGKVNHPGALVIVQAQAAHEPGDVVVILGLAAVGCLCGG
jgi:hypothetical protein